LAHLEVREDVEEDDEASVGGGDEDEAEDDAFVQKYRKVTPNIQDYWIKLMPDQDEFINVLLKTFSEGL